MERRYSKKSGLCASSVSSANCITFNAPLITAKAWAIHSPTLRLGKNERIHREIASLTKIMTAYTVLKLASKMNIDIYTHKVETPFDSLYLGGTTANLIEGDTLTVWDMLHAMLLPSGNDAAYALANHFGALISTPQLYPLPEPADFFVAEMNRNAKGLGLNDTTFANPHGLCDPGNKSSAVDVAKLGMAALDGEVICEIVRAKSHSCLGYDINNMEKTFSWSNTNKLLGKGFSGLKTGVTTTAGPCLVASFRMNGENVVIVLLGSKTGDKRWYEAIKLKDYYERLLNLNGTFSAVKKDNFLKVSTKTLKGFRYTRNTV